MYRVTTALLLFATSCASPLFAACREPAPSGNLTQQLQATYATTLMDATGYKVVQAGCTLVVQKENIQACPSTRVYTRNVYEDGQVALESKSSFLNIGKKLGRLPIPGADSAASATDLPACNGGTARSYMVGEKVYLVGMKISNDKGDTGLVLTLQSCGTCDPAVSDPAHKPYRTDLRVALNKGFLASTDLKSIERVVGEVLAFPEDAAAAADQQAPQAGQPAAPAPSAAPSPAAPPAPPAPQQQTTFPPIAPPPPPADPAPADPVNIAPGQTEAQVKAALGEPDRIIKSGKKEIFSYKSVKVTFVDGKVTDIE